MRVPIYIVLSFILDTLIFKLIDLKTVGDYGLRYCAWCQVVKTWRCAQRWPSTVVWKATTSLGEDQEFTPRVLKSMIKLIGAKLNCKTGASKSGSYLIDAANKLRHTKRKRCVYIYFPLCLQKKTKRYFLFFS